ncbi:hypothetical protein BDZ89DRAFT_1128631 [Hymenopellis radicata]|nr:hypothetical protein BDZ89DRAFT_1128631 [Hymenopellis radicata]
MSLLDFIISELRTGRISITTELSILPVLVAYDYFLTLSDEHTHLWKPKKTLVFFLYAVLRYATLGYHIIFVISFFLPQLNKVEVRRSDSHQPVSLHSFVRKSFRSVHGTPCSLQLSVVSPAIFALRTFAIYQRNRLILAILCIVAVAKTVVSLLDYLHTTATVVPSLFSSFDRCTQSLDKKWNTTSSSLALLFDTLVLGFSIYRTVGQCIRARRLDMPQGVTYFILRDALLYYLSIEVMIISSIVFTQVKSLGSLMLSLTRSFRSSVAAIFEDSVTGECLVECKDVHIRPLQANVGRVTTILQTALAPILTQRLVLNLRDVDNSVSSNPNGTKSDRLDDMQFAHGSVIGNIGAPMRSSLEFDELWDVDGDAEEDDIMEVVRRSEC